MRYLSKTVLFDERSFCSECGSGLSPVYSPVLDEFGRVVLKITGYDDIYARIQAYAPLTDMHAIIAKLNAGDTSAINIDTPMYGDFTRAPSSMAESLQLVIDGERQFNSLPVDVKNKFNNDFKQWFATAGTESWFSKMNFAPPSKVGDVKDVISDNKEISASGSEVSK